MIKKKSIEYKIRKNTNLVLNKTDINIIIYCFEMNIYSKNNKLTIFDSYINNMISFYFYLGWCQKSDISSKLQK